MKISKRHSSNRSKVEKIKLYSLNEAIALLKDLESPKFDETVKVLVLTKSKVDEATEAGADFVGLDEYVEKIEQGWAEMDIVVCTPDAMGKVGKLGRVLGPRGIMPSPKSGTLTNDVSKAIKEIKAGRVEYRVDKNGIIHVPVGKKSFEGNLLQENIQTLISELEKKRPNSVKGTYIRRVCLSSTMGPGIKIDDRSIA
jgi:large subunit ribosomal protein L1